MHPDSLSGSDASLFCRLEYDLGFAAFDSDVAERAVKAIAGLDLFVLADAQGAFGGLHLHRPERLDFFAIHQEPMFPTAEFPTHLIPFACLHHRPGGIGLRAADDQAAPAFRGWARKASPVCSLLDLTLLIPRLPL